MKKIYLFLLVLFCGINLKAQEPAIVISHEVKPDNSVEFNYQKKVHGSYTILITFNGLTNSSEPKNQTSLVVRGFSGNVMRLKPLNANQGIGYSYSFRYFQGSNRVKPDEFTYILPFKKGSLIRAQESPYLGALYFGKTAPEDWKSYNFFTDKEETITAIRKGIVVSIKDEFELDSTKQLNYTRQRNEILVEHPDGTLARYSGFKKGSILVKEGDTVFPQTALGLNSKYSADDTNYRLSLMIYYLKASDFNLAAGHDAEKSLYAFITPSFYTSDGNEILIPRKEYTVESNQEVVSKEFSKRELKNLNGNN